MSNKYSRLWTPARRAKQARNCRNAKPWQHSTGPTSEKGKDKAGDNATKHGLYSKHAKEFNQLLSAQEKFINALIKQLKP